MIKDISNKRFGRLVAIKPTGQKKWGVSLWSCTCDCGKEHVAAINSLKRGLVKSCGCLLREIAKIKNTVHGEYGSPTYKVWGGIIQRCNNNKSTSYPRYGGLGIKVCDSWLIYENFKRDMGDRPHGMSIDRINPHGNYAPDNCRWASTTAQARNKKTPRTDFATAEKARKMYSEGKKPKEISEILGISRGSANGIIYLGQISRP